MQENKNSNIPFIFTKRKNSTCLLREGTLKGIYFKNQEYATFSSYQKNVFKVLVPISYQEIIKEFPSVYSFVKGGGFSSSFSSFCTAINKLLKPIFPLIKVSTDSRIKLRKSAGGRGARAKRQKSYR